MRAPTAGRHLQQQLPATQHPHTSDLAAYRVGQVVHIWACFAGERVAGTQHQQIGTGWTEEQHHPTHTQHGTRGFEVKKMQ